MTRRLATILRVAGAIAALALGAVGYVVYDQLHPVLPANLASFGAVRLTTAAEQHVLLSEAIAPRTPTVVAFWASWCVPCRLEATVLARLRREYRPGALNILYLNVDEVPSVAATTAFLHEAGAEGLPVLYAGPAGWVSTTGQRTITLPRSYIFDRNGRAQTVFSGFNVRDGARDLDAAVLKASSD